MLRRRLLILSVYFLALFGQNTLLAELRPKITVELEKGTPLFELMDREGGLADTMDADAKKKIKIASYLAA